MNIRIINNIFFVKAVVTLFLSLLFLSPSFSNENSYTNKGSILQIPDSLKHKVGSGYLELLVKERLQSEFDPKGARIQSSDPIRVAIYMDFRPTAQQVGFLKNLNIESFIESWTPPVQGHRYGYFLARLPVERFLSALALKFIKRIESAERELLPQNNKAYQAIKADAVWTKGYTGTGIKLAILDSGLDTDPVYSDLPASIQKMDYSNYPTSTDADVENKVTGHGTHVTASALGRGALSAGNTDAYNGPGAYKGMAFSADLIFLKIGNDTNGSASYDAILGAMTAAVSSYNTDIITMSYGGWDTYHDGSDPLDQKVDWCYNQGVLVFISAGNDAADARHCSGMVAATNQTGFIPVNVWGAATNATKLNFNLVWYDGLDANHDELKLKFYNSSFTELVDTTDTYPTESDRGTDSHYLLYNPYLPSGNSGPYYIKVFNSSTSSKNFHIYEDWGDGKVKFDTTDTVPNCIVPDLEFTVSSPSTADHAISVGAWTSRKSWRANNGAYWTYTSETENAICSFSSRGPRVDGVQKPDITAPGMGIVSLRDRDVLTVRNSRWIDNDGNYGPPTPNGDANYYVNQGTSMACPIVAGAAALLLQKDPFMTPEQVYNTLKNYARHDYYTGTVPNRTWGYGKLNIDSAFASSVYVETKVFLEGPYNAAGDSMRTTLRSLSAIPTTSPYAEDSRTVAAIPSSAVDWLLVQLKSTSNGPVLASKSAFLRKDGRIVADDGSTTRITMNVNTGNYYLLINHRNHLSVMSLNSVSLNNSSATLFDFSTDVNKYYGTDAKLLDSTPVTYGMYTGDASGDEQVQNSDKNNYWRSQVGTSGYKSADFNLNGQVQNDDKNSYWRYNVGKGTQVP